MSMTKAGAAEFLGVKPRTVEHYATQGKFTVKYERGQRGQVAKYNDEELKRLKDELEQPSYPTRPALELSPANQPMRAIAEVVAPEQIQALVIAAAAHFERGMPTIADGERLLLTIVDAREHTGLSYKLLRAAISEGALPAKKIGRSWRITPQALRAYIASLMQ